MMQDIFVCGSGGAMSITGDCHLASRQKAKIWKALILDDHVTLKWKISWCAYVSFLYVFVGVSGLPVRNKLMGLPNANLGEYSRWQFLHPSRAQMTSVCKFVHVHARCGYTDRLDTHLLHFLWCYNSCCCSMCTCIWRPPRSQARRHFPRAGNRRLCLQGHPSNLAAADRQQIMSSLWGDQRDFVLGRVKTDDYAPKICETIFLCQRKAYISDSVPWKVVHWKILHQGNSKKKGILRHRKICENNLVSEKVLKRFGWWSKVAAQSQMTSGLTEIHALAPMWEAGASKDESYL